LVNALLYHCADSLSGIGGVMRPGIVHRIDKDTSGALVVAKTDKAHRYLSKQFAKHTVERVYVCLEPPTMAVMPLLIINMSKVTANNPMPQSGFPKLAVLSAA